VAKLEQDSPKNVACDALTTFNGQSEGELRMTSQAAVRLSWRQSSWTM